MSLSLTYDDYWTDLVGKTFVLGRPSAKGEYIILLGEPAGRLPTLSHYRPVSGSR